MLYWHVQDYLPQHLNEKSQMQYITVLFLTMSIIKKKKKVSKAEQNTLKGLEPKMLIMA